MYLSRVKGVKVLVSRDGTIQIHSHKTIQVEVLFSDTIVCFVYLAVECQYECCGMLSNWEKGRERGKGEKRRGWNERRGEEMSI